MSDRQPPDGRRGAVLDLVALSFLVLVAVGRRCWSLSRIITGHHAKGRGHKSEVHSVNFTGDEKFKNDKKNFNNDDFKNEQYRFLSGVLALPVTKGFWTLLDKLSFNQAVKIT